MITNELINFNYIWIIFEMIQDYTYSFFSSWTCSCKKAKSESVTWSSKVMICFCLFLAFNLDLTALLITDGFSLLFLVVKESFHWYLSGNGGFGQIFLENSQLSLFLSDLGRLFWIWDERSENKSNQQLFLQFTD